MSLFGGWGADPFAEQVEKATSENLPVGSEDIALNLDICDQIRSKAVPARNAMRVLKARINHKNPNVVLLALGLTDICIKNGGEHFLIEVSSKEFMDSLGAIVRASGVNPDVRAKSLRLIQNWAQIAEAKPDRMGAVLETYRSLRASNFDFPARDPRDVVSAALVETMTAPEWVDGDVCMRCRTAFSTFNRKHHCRNCGNVFCQQCSSNNMALPWYGVGQDVRVCDSCFAIKGPPKVLPGGARKPSDGLQRSKSVSSPAAVLPSGRGGSASHHRSNTLGAKPSGGGSSRRQKEEDDLALAIKLSLEASGSGSSRGGGYVPSQPPTSAPRATKQPDGRMLEGTDADDDPDLAAAIAASLRDYAPPQPSAPVGLSETDDGRQTPRPHDNSAPASNLPLPPSLELPGRDVDAILTFSQTVAQQEHAARVQGAWSAHTPQAQQAQGLYEKASQARPRMIRSFDEAKRRHGVLNSMHDKLSEAVKLYDRLLDAQMSRPQEYDGVRGGYGRAQPQVSAYDAGYGQRAQAPPHQPSQPWEQHGPSQPGYGAAPSSSGLYPDATGAAGISMYPSMPSAPSAYGSAGPSAGPSYPQQQQPSGPGGFLDRTPSRQSSASYSQYGGAPSPSVYGGGQLGYGAAPPAGRQAQPAYGQGQFPPPHGAQQAYDVGAAMAAPNGIPDYMQGFSTAAAPMDPQQQQLQAMQQFQAMQQQQYQAQQAQQQPQPHQQQPHHQQVMPAAPSQPQPQPQQPQQQYAPPLDGVAPSSHQALQQFEGLMSPSGPKTAPPMVQSDSGDASSSTGVPEALSTAFAQLQMNTGLNRLPMPTKGLGQPALTPDFAGRGTSLGAGVGAHGGIAVQQQQQQQQQQLEKGGATQQSLSGPPSSQSTQAQSVGIAPPSMYGSSVDVTSIQTPPPRQQQHQQQQHVLLPASRREGSGLAGPSIGPGDSPSVKSSTSSANGGWREVPILDTQSPSQSQQQRVQHEAQNVNPSSPSMMMTTTTGIASPSSTSSAMAAIGGLPALNGISSPPLQQHLQPQQQGTALGAPMNSLGYPNPTQAQAQGQPSKVNDAATAWQRVGEPSLIDL